MGNPPVAHMGKDIMMVLHFWKSSFCRPAILFWLSVSLSGQMVGASPITPQTGATTPSQGVSPTRLEHEEIIAKTAAGTGSGDESNQESSQVSHSGKKQRTILKANFEKMRRDSGELADLAKALQEELNKSNENLLSLDVVEKAGKIEKLAKRIKGSARGY